MKIKYHFVNCDIQEIEVSETWGSVMLELERQEYNGNHRETRRHASLDAYNLDDNLLPSGEDIPAEYERKEDEVSIHRAISQLLPEQQRLIRQIFFDGITPSEIARSEGVDKSAISHRLTRALKKLKRFL